MTEMSNAAAGNATVSCPSDELLAAYLSAALNATEHQTLDRHVRTCLACTEAVAVAFRRMRLAGEIARPVPAAVLMRAADTAPEHIPARAAAPHARDWWAALSEQIAGWLRSPVLVPVAVATLALIVVVQQQFNTPELSEKTRAIGTQDQLQVVAPSAAVYTRPSTREAIVATLSRGTTVRILATETDWYRVAIPDGSEGWMERRVFESEG
jgi:hypothetical protein